MIWKMNETMASGWLQNNPPVVIAEAETEVTLYPQALFFLVYDLMLDHTATREPMEWTR